MVTAHVYDAPLLLGVAAYASTGATNQKVMHAHSSCCFSLCFFCCDTQGILFTIQAQIAVFGELSAL
jgi:hypothetical protein